MNANQTEEADRGWLGVAEFAAHAITDDTKCRGRLTFNQDQAIHVACKVAWVAIAWSLRP